MWTLDGTRIFVQTNEFAAKAIIPRLQPLGAGTVLQFFGRENKIYHLGAKVVGQANLAALYTSMDAGDSCTLVTDQGNITVYISSINAKRSEFPWQSIDPAQDCYTPVYDITVELYI
jgi:hypothetical protein